MNYDPTKPLGVKALKALVVEVGGASRHDVSVYGFGPCTAFAHLTTKGAAALADLGLTVAPETAPVAGRSYYTVTR